MKLSQLRSLIKEEVRRTMNENTKSPVEGTRVILKADEEEGWPEQIGRIRQSYDPDGEYGEFFIIKLDDEYLEDDDDDGIREVTIDQMMTMDRKSFSV